MATRRTRIVCISDTHNQTPPLPTGDILIHAGDLTNQGTYSELEKTIRWIESTDFKVKIVVAGNHDITLDPNFYQAHGKYFHNNRNEDMQQCVDLLQTSSSITFLNHESRVIQLDTPDGPRICFKVFGSPWSPSRGLWAFGYAPEEAFGLWEKIPLDTDIVITHTPAKFHCDESFARGSAGCEALRQALWRVRPRLSVSGHIHEGRGVEIVQWDLNSPNIKYREGEVRKLVDNTGNSKKQFRVDLSTKSQYALQNDGSHSGWSDICPNNRGRGREVQTYFDGQVEHEFPRSEDLLPPPTKISAPFPDFEQAERPIGEAVNKSMYITTVATRGQGGQSGSSRRDGEALTGREGRKETCFVNAAVATTSWPHKGGRKFNKPIIIDIDLPIKTDLW